MRVLLIDDEDAILDVFQQALEFEGHEVLIAENGKAALQLLRDREAASLPLPQVILLDLMMPVMDGWEFLRQLREDGASARLSGIPVIVLSAFVDRPQPPGTIAFLRKPIDLDALTAALAKVQEGEAA